MCSNESEVLREGIASWKNSPEEDALNELTAGPSNFIFWLFFIKN